MANKKISELDAIVTLAVDDELAVVDDDVSTTKKATIEQVAELSPSIRDRSRGLVVKTNAGNPNFQVDIDANEIILQDDNGKTARIDSVNITLDITSDLDTGSEANSTWYYLWVTSASTGKLSTSPTAPTISASTKKALVGAVRNDGSGHFIPFYQEDNHVEYNAVQTIFNGAITVGAWTSQSVTAFFPTTAKRMILSRGSSSSQVKGISPRGDGHAGSYAKTTASGTSTMLGVMPTARVDWVMHNIRAADPIYYLAEVVGTSETLVAVGWNY